MVMCFAAREHNFTGRFQYASVLLAFNENLGSAGSSMEQYGTIWNAPPFRSACRSEVQRNYAPGQPEENIVKAGP